ncbi:LOW QUALITY PROTEIN: IQ domain-containing protein N [Equus quagga]|uniref:LOW QUALITY PROTEIN: IQ domain-containing protein N n=1 Tax=Equus quagga TaxID=89248 RepID=UPI001EE2015C|nr:LOW QUALITY PROTEIN: IQ domain-containing protein N [Equus quagga]
MTLQGTADLPRNRDNAASNTVTVVTQWAELLPAPARPSLQDKAGTSYPQPQQELPLSRETLLPQLDKDKTAPHRMPRLRAVVESQAFKNVLVDEMDMMLSRAATLIQANWRGYRLRQKLISQMTAAKAIQEAWRRFSTRRLLRSGKMVEKKVNLEEGDIPYHPPQQVRFQPLEEAKSLPAQPVMVSRETQFPSSDSLAACAHQLALLQSQGTPQPDVQAPGVTGGPGITFLPQQTITIRLPCPVSPDAKSQPCLMTRTVRSTCLVHHVEGDMMKTKQVISRANKAGASGPPFGKRAQAAHGPLKTQPQAPAEAEVLRAPAQRGPVPVMTKTPPQPCPAATKTLLQMYPAAMMTKTSPQPCPVPTVTITKTPTQVYPVAPMTKTPPQTYPRGVMTKIPPQPGPATPMTKTPAQMQPTASMTNTSPQTRPVAMMTKTPPQTCPMASMIKPPTQTRPAAMITKTPPQMYPMDTMTKTPLQTCPAVAKTPSQMLSGAAVTKTPPQTRLTAMITKTPAQLRSVAAILKTLCLPPPAAPPPAGVAAAIPNTSSHASLDGAKARAVANTRQAAGMVKVSSHSYLTEGKVKCFPPPALGAVAPKAPARPPLEAEKIKAFPQKQGKTETARNTSAAAEMPRAPSWAKVAEDGSKAHLRMDIRKVQSQVYVPVEMAVALPQAQVATRVSTASCQTYPPAKLTKAQSLAHLDTCLTKVQAQARPANGAVKVQSQVHLPAGLSTAPSQAQMVSETAKCFYAAHQPAELSSKTQSQPLLAGFKASTQPCQHVGTLGILPRAKLEDRLTQLQPHSCAQGKATQGPRQGAFETQSLPVPLLASAGHSTCNVESWGDSVAARAQPSLASPAIPCQEELAASQLASLCAELAALLGSQEDIRALLARALSQGEARAALNQALSSDVLGSTVAKALSPGMLGTALVKVLSWSKLDIALSHTMSWGELQAKLTKATQGKLVDALSKALTEEEHAALSQALCQGELGAILSQPLSQAALRTGAGLPKAATKMMRSGMTVMPSPMEVDRRESPVATCGPILSPGRPQPSKVRVLSAGVWEGFVTGWPTRLLEGMGDGAGIMGSPCSSVVSVGASLTRRVITTIYQHPLAAALDPTLSQEMGPSRDSSLQLYLNLEVSEENVCPHPVVRELASDLNPVANDTGPNLPRSPHLQPPPSVWQPLIANGVGPSTSQPSVASGTALSSHNPHVVSRVASRPWASSGQGRVAPGQFLSTVGNGRANQSHQCATAHGGSACWCQSSGVGRVPPSVYRPSMAKGPQQPSMVPEEDMQRTQSPNHKRASLGTRDVINKVTSSPQRAATVSKVSSTQPRTHKACDVIPLLLPGSVAPARRQAPKTQADASPSQASPGSPLASHLLHMATSGQERNRMQATVSSMHCPQGLLMGPTLRKLVASLPQGSDDDLARSFSQGSTDYSPNMSDSQSSLCTCSLHSMSASSVASLTSVHLVEEESWEASSHKDLLLDGSLSGEAMERPLELEDVEETEIVGHRHMIPNLHQQSPAASEPTPTLYHSSVSSHMTLGVHWGSDGQDDRDMSLGQSSMGPKESLSQKPDRTGLTRSLSSGNVVPTIYQQPSVARRLTPSLLQPSVASKVAPTPGQPSLASGVTLSLSNSSKANGVAPTLGRTSITSRAAPSLGQPSRTSGVAPTLGRTSMISGVAPRLAQPSVTSGVAPSLGRTSMTSGVVPRLAQPSMTSSMAPSLGRTSMTSGVAPSQPQPSVTSGLAPRLAQPSVTSEPSVTSGVAPRLAQLSMTCGAAPSLAQPLMTSGVAPSLAQPSVTSGVAPRLGQPSVTTLLAFRRPQPPVISGKGGALSQPSWAPGVSSNALSSRVNAVAPSPCHSSFVSEVTSSAPYPCVTSSMGQALSQPFVAPGLGPCQDPLTARGEAPHLWAPEFCEVSLGFCQPLSVGGRCPTVTEHPSAAPSAPVLHQACMARGEDSDSGQASSVCQGIVFRDMAACIPQGAVAAGMFPRMAPGTLAAGMFLSVSQGPMCPGMTGSMCQRRVMTGMSPDQSQVVSGTAPMAAPAAVADAPLGHEQASEVGPGCSLASLLCGLAMSPSKSLASRGPGTSQGHVDLPTSLDHQCPPVPTVAASGYQQVYDFSWEPGMGIASGLAPCSVASRMTTAVTLGTVVSGVAPSLLPGYTVNGVVQPLPPGAMVSGMIRTLPLGSVASGVSPSLSVAPEAGGKRRDLPGGPSASLTALSLPQGSEASAPPGSVASSAVPASMVGGLNQGLALGPMASAACLPSAAGSMAPSLLQGSMLVETTPQLYQEALAGEGSTVPFQASHATSLAQVHPQASEAGGPARGVHQVPTVLQRASQLHQALGVAPSETTDGQAMMKPQDLYEAVSQVSMSSEQSVVLEDTPWMGDSPLATEIDHSREFLVEDGTLPNGQRPLLEEVVPSQAKSMTSGMAPVPPQPSSFAKHSIGGSVTPILQQPISWGAPSSHFVAASRVPSVQMGSVKGTGAPLAHQQSSVAHIIPQSHSYGIQASPTVSGSPKPACGSTVASSLHLGTVAGMGTPSTSRSGAFSVASAVPPYPSMASRAASGGLQMEAVPSAPRKPVSGDVAQNSHHGFLSSRKSYRSVHGKLVSEMPDDSLAKIVQEQAFRSAQEGPKYSTGPPLAPPPIIRTGQVAHNAAAPRLHLGRRRVSLGYESSPSGSRRPLCSHESLLGSQDFHSAVAPVDSHRASLTPAVLQGPTEAGVAGGQAWNSAVPSVAAGPMNSAAAPGGVWEPARATVPWDAVGSQVVADPRQSGELVVSVQDMEKIISQAVVTIQACARGYLVRRTIRVWHQWAIVIQAAWRGYRVRQELARLSRAAIVIQATWRGFCTRRGRAQQTLQPGTWAEMGGGTRTTSDHRCFQSCQPHVCALCQSLSPGLGSPPSVVMLVGSSPRTCHMCGQSLPTRVVHGTGQGSWSQAGTPWDCASQPVTPSLQQSHLQNKAATTIQSSWRGFLVRRRLRQQQGAAKMLQATWRGHSARSSLTTDALLGPAAWDNPQHTQWPGV